MGAAIVIWMTILVVKGKFKIVVIKEKDYSIVWYQGNLPTVKPEKDHPGRGDMIAYLLVVITVISVGVCYYVAGQRGLSKPYWIFMGVLFGPIAIPFVFLVKSKHADSDGAH